ncbi:MAG: RusA family crossover junction endodeoxyribonuclease [Pandoraea sp.]|uniref:RusA family crossover junction endodeoxyribonuclease n=1 Tax=Pandoraea sp. TaxID=1883445 RepID=UPI00122815E4|nr:RusA family crossover junction endodeoxyribonuclease [Pandoraea sp.]TAM15952.1 MAG: RusA family crossover junction endodeoxyribonuclease [Pandoraea sp.]
MLTVTLPYPISANRYWRSRVIKPHAGQAIVSTYVSPEAKAYKEQVGWLCRAAGIRSPLPGRIAIAYTLYPKRPQDWRMRQRKLGDAWQDTVQCIDLDNAQKVLLDALKGIAFEDDVWVRRITAERAEPDGEGRLVVTVTPIATEAPQAGFDFPAPRAELFDPLEV